MVCGPSATNERIDQRIVDGNYCPDARQVVNLHRLTDEEAHRFPVEAGAHQCATIGTSCSHIKSVCYLDRRRRIEGTLDDEPVIAFAEHQIDHLNGAHGVVSAEIAVRIDTDAPEADAAGEEAGFTECRIAGHAKTKAEIISHVEAG
jgi:hypothetical protein